MNIYSERPGKHARLVITLLVALSLWASLPDNARGDTGISELEKEIEGLRSHLPQPIEKTHSAWSGLVTRDRLTDELSGRLSTSVKEDETDFYTENKDVSIIVRCDTRATTVEVHTNRSFSTDRVNIIYRFDDRPHVTSEWLINAEGETYPEMFPDDYEHEDLIRSFGEHQRMLLRIQEREKLNLLSFSLDGFERMYREVCEGFSDYRVALEQYYEELQRDKDRESTGAETDGAGAAEPELTQGELKTQYSNEVRSYFERRKRYPRQAQMRGQEGYAIVRLEVNREGRLIAYEIVDSTGYTLLDDEIYDLFERADALPEPPERLAGETFELDFPLEFPKGVKAIKELKEEYARRWQKEAENVWTRPPGSERGLSADIRVQISPEGEVVSSKIANSSGSSSFDRSATNAIRRASPLSVPAEVEMFREAGFDDFILRFDPD